MERDHLVEKLIAEAFVGERTTSFSNLELQDTLVRCDGREKKKEVR